MTLTKDEIAQGMARLERGFMTPQVCHAPHAVRFEDEDGETFFDLDGKNGDVIGQTKEPQEIEPAPGWYSRLSASGYMDCTEWSGPFETEEQAAADLVETHDDGNDTDSDDS